MICVAVFFHVSFGPCRKQLFLIVLVNNIISINNKLFIIFSKFLKSKIVDRTLTLRWRFDIFTRHLANFLPAMLSILSIICVVIATSAEAVTKHPLMVIVSFDGFRADYIRPEVTPHMHRFRDESAAPPYMRNVFPTKTFVNHFTMATGLYPETHGVLDNYMFDRNGQLMHYTYEQFHYDESIVPIWMQNEYSGDGRHSGVMMWPGSDFTYQGKTPTYIQKFNNSMPFETRVDKILPWIKDEKRPANLILMYFEEPDSTGHLTGDRSKEMQNQIVKADNTVKYLLDKIKYEKLEDKINLIILSDHGMNIATYDKIIYLNNYVSNTTSKVITTGPNAFIYPNPGKFDEIYKNLVKEANNLKTFDVYKKDQLPNRWYMKNTSRLAGIIYLLAKPGYVFWDEYIKSILVQTTKEKFRTGTHGYDNDDPLMHAIFMASGPIFKKKFTAKPFDNIDLYPLISSVMGMKELASNIKPNGTMAGVEQLLLSKSNTNTSSFQGKQNIAAGKRSKCKT